MELDVQRVRNLTTGRLHTNMDDIYQDIEAIIGETGIMTHHLGMACNAMKPYLEKCVGHPRFWDDQYDPTHEGTVTIVPMTEADRKDFFEEFEKQPNPLLEALGAKHD